MPTPRAFVTRILRTLVLALAVASVLARAQPPADAGQAGPRPAAKPEPQQPDAEATRAQRRAAWRAMMHGLRTPADLPAPVRQELRNHAWRMARLMRIRALALGAHAQALVTRADVLLARELTRHRERLVHVWPAAPRKRPKVAPVAPRDEGDDDERGEREPDDTEDPEARP